MDVKLAKRLKRNGGNIDNEVSRAADTILLESKKADQLHDEVREPSMDQVRTKSKDYGAGHNDAGDSVQKMPFL